MVAQLCAHLKGQLCCGQGLRESLRLQTAAPQVKAEGTVPVSAGIACPQRAERGHGTGTITYWGQLGNSELPTHHPEPAETPDPP